MTLRLVPANFTFEQQRQQINLIASDVGDLAYLVNPADNIVKAINDIATGNVTLSGQTIGFENGSITTPSIFFDSSPDLGLYQYNSSTLGVTKNLTVNDNLDVKGNTTISGYLTVGGDITFRAGTGGSITLGDSNTDNVIFGADINSDLIPNINNAYNLGSETKQWNVLYTDEIVTVSGVASLYNSNVTTVNAFGAATAINLGANTGTLTVGNPTVVGTQSTQNLYNTVATTVNAFGAATSIGIGAATGTTNIKNNLDVDGDLNIDGGDLTVSTSSFNLANTTATTVNAFGAATSIGIGAATGTTNIKNNLDVDGDLNIDGGDLTVSTSTFNLANTTADTVNAFGAATNITIGGTTGTTTIRNANTSITGDLAVNGGDFTTSASSFNLLNTTATTVNAFGAATSIGIGAATGTTNIKNNLDVDGDLNIDGGDLTVSTSTFNLANTTADTINAFGAATSVIIGSANGTTETRNNFLANKDLTIGGSYLNVQGQSTFYLINTGVTTLNAFGGATAVNIGSTSGQTTIKNQLKVDGGTINLLNQDTSVLVRDNSSRPWQITASGVPYIYLESVSGARKVVLNQDTDINGNLLVTGDITFRAGTGGSITLGDTNTDNVVFSADVNSNIIPNSNNTYDLGSTTQKWRNIYVESGVSAATLTADSLTLSGDLAVNGGDITSTSPTFNLLTGSQVSELNFGTDVTAINIGSLGSGIVNVYHDLHVFGALVVSGITNQLETNVLNVYDPVIQLGNTTLSGVTYNDGYDRGIVFKYVDGITPKIGFFGYHPETNAFTYIPDATETAPFQYDGVIGTLTVSGITGSAARLTTPRTIAISGPLVGSVLFDGSQNVTISGSVTPNSIILGQDTSGSYTTAVTVSGVGITLVSSGITDDGSSYQIISNATSDNIADTLVSRDANGNFFASAIYATLSGNAATASRLETPRSITLSGDTTGTVLFDGSNNVIINTTIEPDSVALGNDTTGQFAKTVTISGIGIYANAANLTDGTDYVIQSTATDLNTPNSIVYRDSSGNFNAGVIYATLSGTARNVSHALVAGTGISFNSGALNEYDGTYTVTIATAQDVGTGANVQFNDLVVGGNLTVNGTTTTLNSTILTVDDINIELGSIKDGLGNYQVSDTTANTGGITLKGTTDKTITWLSSNNSWNSSENFSVASGKTFKVNGTDVLSSTTLGAEVINSSLQNVGTLTNLEVAGNTYLATSTGNVGIKTSSPTQELDVNGDIRIRNGIYDSTNYNGVAGEFLSTTASGVQWKSLDVTNLLYVTKDGNDANDGLSLFQAKASIKSALSVAESLIIGENAGIRSDAAIMLATNKDFIKEEAYGYILEKYPTLSGVTNISKCKRDIGYVVNAFIGDLREGGNINSVDAGEYYYTASGITYINGEQTETKAAFAYARDLSIAAMRNWDYQLQNCTISSGSPNVTVTTTVGMVVGMLVTGTGIPSNTYVKSITNGTTFVLGNASRTSTVNATSSATVTLTFNLNTGVWASGVTPTVVSGVTTDTNYPECAGVATAITTYASIISNIIDGGIGTVPRAWPNAGIRISVSTGTYTEQNPLRVPTNVSVHGDNLRSVNVIPANPTSDVFYVHNGSYLTGMTFQGHQYPSAAVAFPPTGAGLITKSPYVQNCTSITSTGCGMRVDGNLAAGTKSMVLDSYTQYNQGGDGIVITNGGYAQLVSIFEICCDRAVYVSGGGTCSITNSNTDFGTYGLVSDGTGPLQYTGAIKGSGQSGSSFVIDGVGANRPYVGQVITIGQLYYTLLRVNVTNGGSGYTSAPSVTIGSPTGPGGIPAQAIATLENGSVTEVTVLVSGSQFITAPSVTIAPPASGVQATADAEIYPTYYTINSSTAPVNGECTITIEETLPWSPSDNDTISFYQVSRIIASSHCFEYVGTGTNINTALPSLGGVPIQENEAVTLNGGRIAITSTDHLGNFRIGADLVINQNTGTLSGRTFSKSLLAELTPFILALQ